MIDPEIRAVATNKTIRTLLLIRRIHRIRDKVLKIIGYDDNNNQTTPKPIKKVRNKNLFPMIGACLVMAFLSSCAPMQTAIIPCKNTETTQDCIRDNLGKHVKVMRIVKIDTGLYMVDYK